MTNVKRTENDPLLTLLTTMYPLIPDPLKKMYVLRSQQKFVLNYFTSLLVNDYYILTLCTNNNSPT